MSCFWKENRTEHSAGVWLCGFSAWMGSTELCMRYESMSDETPSIGISSTSVLQYYVSSLPCLDIGRKFGTKVST